MKELISVNIKQNSFQDAPKGEFVEGVLNIVFDPDADGYISLAFHQKYHNRASHVLIKERDEKIFVPSGIGAVFLDCHHSDGIAAVVDHHKPYENENCTAVQVADRIGCNEVEKHLARMVQVRDLMQGVYTVGEQLHLEGMALSHYLFNSTDTIGGAEVGSLKWWDYVIRFTESELDAFIERIVPSYEKHLKDVKNYAERMIIEGESFTHPLIEGRGLEVEDNPLMYEARRDILNVTSHDYLVMKRKVSNGILHICRSLAHCDLRSCVESYGSGGHKNAASFVIPSDKSSDDK